MSKNKAINILGQNRLPKEYIRDNRSPVPLNNNVSKVMSSIKGANTNLEKILRKGLYSDDIRGYRLNWKNAPGKPDIAFPGKQIAIFVHGCYWHRCQKCNFSMPKTNIKFWKNKFEKNVERDKNQQKKLLELGWRILIFWECEIKNDLFDIVSKIKFHLQSH